MLRTLREWAVRGAAAFHGRRRDDDIAEELRLHLELAEEEARRRGHDPAEARRRALLHAGGMARAMDTLRDRRGLPWIDALRRDVQYGLRTVRRAPRFTAVVVATLALGIGATTAIFSAVYAVMLRPLPFPDAQRLVMIWDGDGGMRNHVTFGTFRELSVRSRAFSAMAVARPFQINLRAASDAEPERLTGQYVSADFFRVLGVRPAFGRDFEAADDRPRTPFVAILSDGLWRRQFRADPSVLGRQVHFEDVPVTIIGIMPPGFESPASPAAEIWSALQYDPSLPRDGREWGRHLTLLGRLRPELGIDAATSELAGIAATRHPDFARAGIAALSDGFIVGTLRDEMTRVARPMMLVVLGAVVVLLAIACSNVTNLLLGRAAERRTEIAIRRALGASQGRIVGQLLVESVIISALGGALGVALAYQAIDVLTTLSPPDLPRIGDIAIDRVVIVGSVALTTLVGLAVGVIPALQSARRPLQRGMQLRSRSATGQTTRRVLVVSQVGLAVMLMAGAGLLIRSLNQLFAVQAGFEPNGVLALQIAAGGRQFRDDATTHRLFDQVLEAARQLPGVTAAAVSSQLPLSGDQDEWGVRIESQAQGDSAYRYAVSPGYFEAMRIALRKGRLLTRGDTVTSPRVAVVSEALARRHLPGVDPVGQRIRVGPETGAFTIVGVVADVKQTKLDEEPAAAVYIPAAQWLRFADRARWLVLRGPDVAALAPAVRRAIHEIDPAQPVIKVGSMRERVQRSAADRVFARLLFVVFGGVALLLAAIGTYSLLSASVIERTREIGIRSAMGASRGDILRLVVGQGLVLTSAGVAIGLAGALGGGRALQSLLYQVRPADPATLGAVTATLMAVALIACWFPAWRASRLDPSVVLRGD
jgi:predicted permease